MENTTRNMKTEDKPCVQEEAGEIETKRVWYLDPQVGHPMVTVMSTGQIELPQRGGVLPTEDGHIRRAKVATPAILSDRGMWVSKQWCERVWDPLNSRMNDGTHVHVWTNGSKDVKCPYGVVIVVGDNDPMTIDVRDELIEVMKRIGNDVIQIDSRRIKGSKLGSLQTDFPSGDVAGPENHRHVDSRNKFHRHLHDGLRAGDTAPGPSSLQTISLAIKENCDTVAAVYRHSIRCTTLLEAIRKAIFSQIFALTRPVSEALLSPVVKGRLWTVKELLKTSNSEAVTTVISSQQVITLPHDYIHVDYEGTSYVATLGERSVGGRLKPLVPVAGFFVSGYDGFPVSLAAKIDENEAFPYLEINDRTLGSVIEARRLTRHPIGATDGLYHFDEAPVPISYWGREIDQERSRHVGTDIHESVRLSIMPQPRYLKFDRIDATREDYGSESFLEGGHLFITMIRCLEPLTGGHLVRELEDGDYPRMGSLALSRFLVCQGRHKAGIRFTAHLHVFEGATEGRRRDHVLVADAPTGDAGLAFLNTRMDTFLYDRIVHGSMPMQHLVDSLRAGQLFYANSWTHWKDIKDRINFVNEGYFEEDGYPEHCGCGARLVITREDGYECAAGCDEEVRNSEAQYNSMTNTEFENLEEYEAILSLQEERLEKGEEE